MAGISDSTVSLAERGHWRSLSFGALEKLAAVLDVRLELSGSWRGGDGGRLVSRSHSLLSASFAAFIKPMAEWTFEPEVSYSIYGERGVLDWLGSHRRSGHLVVVELKTEFVDFNEVLGTVDRYVRLARRIAAERGWAVTSVSCWLIVTDTRTNRRHLSEHAALLRAKFPADGRQLRSFLLHPGEPTFGVAFWPDSSGPGIRQAVGGGKARVRVPKDQARPETEPGHDGNGRNCPLQGASQR